MQVPQGHLAPTALVVDLNSGLSDSIDTEAEVVIIVLVGEKRGDALIVRGEEFREHHEDHSSE